MHSKQPSVGDEAVDCSQEDYPEGSYITEE